MLAFVEVSFEIDIVYVQSTITEVNRSRVQPITFGYAPQSAIWEQEDILMAVCTNPLLLSFNILTLVEVCK